MIDKKKVSQNFHRAVDTYDEYAHVQRLMAQNLISTLKKNNTPVNSILEIGSGTGWLTDQLLKLYPQATIDIIDIAPAMVARCQKKYSKQPRVQTFLGDGELLPSITTRYELIISNACFQWFRKPAQTMKKYLQHLQANGVLLFATFGENTFHELHTSFVDAYTQLNNEYKAYHAPEFPSFSQWEKFLQSYTDVSLEEKEKTYFFPSVHAFSRSVKGVGAGNASQISSHAPIKAVRLMRAIYEQKFQTQEGIPATYHIIYGRAVKNR